MKWKFKKKKTRRSMEELPLHRTRQLNKQASPAGQEGKVRPGPGSSQSSPSVTFSSTKVPSSKWRPPHPKSSLAHWTEARMEFQLPAQDPWFCCLLLPPLTGLPTADRIQSLATLEKVPTRTVLFSEMAAAPWPCARGHELAAVKITLEATKCASVTLRREISAVPHR